ncbi:MAG: sugar ABC transporter permease [Clostridia bacterium]|nr:sugar ABC transporter permease [Clostridia bacterium]MBP5665902.1 sugar ABC transporter permease [Clostridia bacterium]
MKKDSLKSSRDLKKLRTDIGSRNQLKGWLYLAPALLLLLIFSFYPLVNTFKMAFQNGYNGLAIVGGESFKIGIENFKSVVNFVDFKLCLKNTILLCVITVPISTILALLIAVALNSIKPLQKVYQTVFFLPYVTNSIAIGMVFNAMFTRVGLGDLIETQGIINNILKIFNLGPYNFVNVGSTWGANMFVVCTYIIWNAIPFKILVLLGGLQNVNKQYYEAAKIDGTSKIRTFFRITVPLLSPMLAYVIITSFIGGFKEYSSVVGIFGEGMGPGDNGQMNTIVGYVYKMLPKSQLGNASAASLILFGIILIVTAINGYVSKKSVHY